MARGIRSAGHSIRGIARELDVSRGTIRKYLKTPEALAPKVRKRRGSKLDPYTEYIDRRLGEGLENCVVLHRELTGLGYDGGYSILKATCRLGARAASRRRPCGLRRGRASRRR